MADEGKNETLEDFEIFTIRNTVNIIAYSVMSAGKKWFSVDVGGTYWHVLHYKCTFSVWGDFQSEIEIDIERELQIIFQLESFSTALCFS